MDSLQTKEPIPYPSVSDLVAEGLSSSITYTERRLEVGEGKTKLAFLSFSSGTTGKPKVFRTMAYFIFIYPSQRIQLCLFSFPRKKAVAIPHSSVISNVIQMAAYHKVNENYTSWEKRRFRPGDIAAAGMGQVAIQ